jgi:transposase
MTEYREILRLQGQGVSQRAIAESLACSRNTVARVLKRAKELTISWPLSPETTDAVLDKLFYPDTVTALNRRLPDNEYIHRELAKSGVNLKLLWSEYCEECKANQEIPLMYSQFCYYYQQYSQRTRATMHIPRKPAEQIEVDWAGQAMEVVDSISGEVYKAYLFVGVLPYSQYTYVEAFLSQDLESWINAHVNMFRFFGGAAKMLVPDNLKTGVDKTSWYNPVINKTYHEMSEYYDTAVVPARVRRPKDKPSVEGMVGVASTWIMARLRNQKYFTLGELNQDILTKLDELNSAPFQKREGCRQSVFLAEEKPLLLPLPSTPYELATWRVATVQFNYHIAVDKMHYSVPYEYIKRQVDVRITRNIVEVFYNNHRIASHRRIQGRLGQYSTADTHMPPDHQTYIQWNADRFIKWGETVGPHTKITIKAILASHKVEQQAYRSCMGLLKLADKYSVERLENACQKALSYTPAPSLKSVKAILGSGQDKVKLDKAVPAEHPSAQYGFTRGAEYYGRFGSYDK